MKRGANLLEPLPAPMPDPDRVAAIRCTVTQEVLHALGLPRHWWGKPLVDALLWLPARRFARKMAQFDEEIARLGIAAAAQHLLRDLTAPVKIWGAEHIPPTGPVLLACNHPGAYDTFAVLTGIRREDLRMVVSGVDFTRSLPMTSPRLIYVTPEMGARMTAVRQSLRHLQQGGLLFIYPTGLVDPDPALWPQPARQALQNWSSSLEILLHQAPETQLVIAIASHVLAESCARHPLTLLVKQDWQRRRLAEYIQIIQQLSFGRRLGLVPRVSFAPPCNMAGLSRSELRAAIQERALQALEDHLQRAEADFQAVGG